MKFSAWKEEKEIRGIATGGGILETRKGDLVIVAVIEKWSDANAAIEALKKLIGQDGEQ